MKTSQIDALYIRSFAAKEFVEPARARGEAKVEIPVRSVLTALTKLGLKSGRTPAICSALEGKKFQSQNHIELVRREGPPSGKSPTVVFHYEMTDDISKISLAALNETPEERAFRLTERIRGLMREEIAAHGGAVNYLRWVRGEDVEAA